MLYAARRLQDPARLLDTVTTERYQSRFRQFRIIYVRFWQIVMILEENSYSIYGQVQFAMASDAERVSTAVAALLAPP